MRHRKMKNVSVRVLALIGIVTCSQGFASDDHQVEFFTSQPSSTSFFVPSPSNLFQSPSDRSLTNSAKVILRLGQSKGRFSSHAQIESALQKHGLSSFVKLQTDGSTSSADGIERFDLSYLGKQFCYGFVRKVPGIWNQPIVVSDFPVVSRFEEVDNEDLDVENLPLDRWSVEANVDDQIDLNRFHLQNVIASDSCWLVKRGSARLVQRLRFENDVILASRMGIEAIEATSFDIKSQATVPLRHAMSNQWTTVEFETDESSYLQNSWFVTAPVGQRYRSSQGGFVWPEDQSSKEELFSFASANLQQQFIQSFNGIWTKSEPVVIKTGLPNIEGRVTATYYWADGGFPPTISISRGEPGSFENLGLDGDVVSHEFNHHVIYQSIKGTKGQSRAIHEGLADFLVAARTKDTCIGSIVCGSSDDSTCKLFRQQCLRNLNQDFDFREVRTFDGEAVYNQSMVLSGFLWDLISKHSVPRDLLVNMVLRAINLVPERPSFLDFMNALKFVDQEMGGAFKGAIDAAARARTLDKESLDALTNQAYLSEDKGYHANSKKKSEFERAMGCSTLGKSSQNSTKNPLTQAILIITLLLGVPLCCALNRRIRMLYYHLSVSNKSYSKLD